MQWPHLGANFMDPRRRSNSDRLVKVVPNGSQEVSYVEGRKTPESFEGHELIKTASYEQDS